MAHSKQARKRIRQNTRHRAHNRSVKSDIKAIIKRYRATTGDAAAKVLVEAESKLDKAAKRRIIPPGRANRLKGRLRRFALRAKTKVAAPATDAK